MNPRHATKKLFVLCSILAVFLTSQALAQTPVQQPVVAAANNKAPSVSGIPGQTVDEGGKFTEINLDQYVTDSEDQKQTIIWKASGQQDLKVSINNRKARITIPNSDWNGIEEITFTAKDPKGATGSETVSFTVNSINDKPVTRPIPPQSIQEGSSFQPIHLDQYVTDADHPLNQLMWSVELTNISQQKAEGDMMVTIDPNRVAQITLPDTNWYGAYKLLFTAIDGEGATATTQTTLTVRPVNDPPIVQTIPDQTIEEGGEFEVINLNNYVSDADNSSEEIKWSISGGSRLKAVLDKYNMLTIKTPDANYNGPTETFNISARDPKGGQRYVRVKFTVKSVNDIPQFEAIPSQTIKEGGQFKDIPLDQYVTDQDHRFQQLHFTFEGAQNLTVRQVGRNLKVAVKDTNWFGDETILIKVDDPEKGHVENSVLFSVQSVNDLPFVSRIPNQTIQEGSKFAVIKLDDYVTDGDQKDSELSWEFSVKTLKAHELGDVYVQMNNNRVATILLPDTNYYGSAAITFTVTDLEGAKAQTTATFTVNSVNDIPVLRPPQDQTIEEGNSFVPINLDDLVSDSDHAPNQMTWKVSGQRMLKAVIDPRYRVLNVYAPDPEYSGPTEQLTLTVTDPERGSASTQVKYTIKSINDAPEMKELKDQIIQEGSQFAEIDLNALADDKDHQDSQLKWTFSGARELKVSKIGYKARIQIPNKNWHGTEMITFMVTDPANAKAERTATFTVESVNDIPQLRRIPDQTIQEGQLFTAIKLDDIVSDEDHSKGDLSWETSVSLPPGAKGTPQLAVNIDAARIARILIPDTNWNGSEIITFTVTDPEGGRQSVSAHFKVRSINDPPFVDKYEGQTIDEGAEFAAIHLDDYVRDSDHLKSELTWTAEGGAALKAVIDRNHVATIKIPDKEWSGNPETFRFIVTDPEGAKAAITSKFTVRAINDPPVMKDIPNQKIREGESFNDILLDQYVTDLDHAPNQLKWTVSGQNKLKVSINAQRKLHVSAPDTNWHGEEFLTIRVSDGAATAERMVTYTVLSVNDKPYAQKPLRNQKIKEGQKFAPIKLTEIVHDADHQNADLTWNYKTVKAGTKGHKTYPGELLISMAQGVATITAPDTNWNGSEDITFTATDPEGASVSLTANFTIESVNDLPVLRKIPDQTIQEKARFNAIPLADLLSDSDHPNSQIKLSVSGNRDLKVSIDRGLLATIVQPNKYWNGSERITITATDPEGGKASQSFTLTVQSVNDAPVLSQLPNQTIKEGEAFRAIDLNKLVSDADHNIQQLKWKIEGLQALKAQIVGGNRLTVTPPNPNWHGTETFILTVTDPLQATAQTQAIFEVRSVNDLPVLKAIPNQTINEGGTFQTIPLNQLVSDADHQIEDLTWEVRVTDPNPPKQSRRKKRRQQPEVIKPKLTVSIASGIATVNIPDENWNGKQLITFMVSDPEGGKATQSALFEVRSVNDVPIIAQGWTEKVATVNEGEPLPDIQLGAIISDADHPLSALKIEVEGAKQLKSYLNRKTLILSVKAPSKEWSGKETLTLKISDPENGRAVARYTYVVKSINDAPSIQKIPGQVIREGGAFTPVQLDRYVKDPDHAPNQMKWTVRGAQQLKAQISGNVLQVSIPDTNWYGGPETLTLKVEDPQGASAETQVSYTVKSVNDKPIQKPMKGQTIAEGETFAEVPLDQFVTDADHKIDEMKWVVSIEEKGKKSRRRRKASQEPNLSVQITSDRRAVFTIPGENWFGERLVTFRVTDPEGAQAVQTVPYVVKSVNDIPVIQKIPDQEIDEGGKFKPVLLSGLISDVDDPLRKLKLDVQGQKALKAFINRKMVLFVQTPNKNWSGKEELTVVVQDPQGGKATQKVLYSARPINDAPVISKALRGQTISEGMDFELVDVSKVVYDVDNTPEELTWSVSGAKDLKIEYNRGKQLFRITAPDSDWSGKEVITFTVTDPDKATDSKKAVFQVKAINDPPQLKAIPPQKIKEGNIFKAIDLTKVVSDVDTKLENLVYTLDNAQPRFKNKRGRVIGRPKPSTIRHKLRVNLDEQGILQVEPPDDNWYGKETIQVCAWDTPQSKACTDIVFEVESVNDEPMIIGELKAMVTNEGKAFAPIQLDKLVADEDHKPYQLKWSFRGNNRLDVRITKDGEALVTPRSKDWFGQERITFTVEDPLGAKATLDITFQVKHVNNPPVLKKIPNQTIKEDESFSPIMMDQVVSDKDHSTAQLKWKVTGNQNLLVDIDRVRGEIRVKQPRADWNGAPEVLTIAVMDPEGAIASQQVTYKVIPVNDLPQGLFHSYTTKEGEVLQVSKEDGLLNNAIDPDGPRPSICLLSQKPSNGKIKLSRDGSFIYVPNEGFSGVDEFTFTVKDNQGGLSKPCRAEINVMFKLGDLRAQ